MSNTELTEHCFPIGNQINAKQFFVHPKSLSLEKKVNDKCVLFWAKES